MMIDIILNILFVLVLVAYAVANIIQSYVAITDGYTFKEVLDYSQDTKIGKILMTIFYIPAFLFITLWPILKKIALASWVILAYIIHYIKWPFKKVYKKYPVVCSYICAFIGMAFAIFSIYIGIIFAYCIF